MDPREELQALRRLAELEAKAAGQSSAQAPYTAGQMFKDELMTSLPGGLVRGVKDVIDTGAGFLSRLGGADEAARVKAMNDAGKADFEAAKARTGNRIAPEIGRIAGNVAATMPVTAGFGSAVGAVAPRIGAAISSGGFVTGGARPVGMAAKAADLGIRTAGGAVAGGVSAGLVNPDDAATGAIIGGVLPGGVQALGRAGQAVGSPFKSSRTRASERLAAALEQDAAVAAAKLQNAQELVPGSRPTVAQILRTPQAGILERVVGDSPGGALLKERYAAQSAARNAALDRVAPVDPRGFRSAQVDLGEELTRTFTPLRQAENKRVGALFDQVDPESLVRMRLPLGPMQDAADKFLGAGTVGQGDAARKVLSEANRIGTVNLDAIKPVSAGAGPQSLAQAVRQAGGLSLGRNSGVVGEVKALGKDLKNLTRRTGGLSPAQMAEKMAERGMLPDEDVNTLLNALRDEAAGDATYAVGDDMYRQFAAAREAAMGDAPMGGVVPKPVTWREAQNLRSSINDLWSQASANGRNREAAALQKMLDAIDNATEDIASGKLAPDEVFPDNVAAKWRQALDEFKGFKQRFETGPQYAMFRQGADGRPMIEGGEVAQKFWGVGPGAAENVRSFRRLIDDNPKLLGQFRSMVTTEGAGTASARDELGAKFVRWVDSSLPGLKAAFDPAEVKQLQRIAADVKRSIAAASDGMSRGSNTYQNAANALSLGLLDSPFLNAAANRIPLVNNVAAPTLQWMREGAKERMANELAQLLADPTAAANALMQVGAPRQPNALVPYLARPLPVLAADR